MRRWTTLRFARVSTFSGGPHPGRRPPPAASGTRRLRASRARRACLPSMACRTTASADVVASSLPGRAGARIVPAPSVHLGPPSLLAHRAGQHVASRGCVSRLGGEAGQRWGPRPSRRTPPLVQRIIVRPMAGTLTAASAMRWSTERVRALGQQATSCPPPANSGSGPPSLAMWSRTGRTRLLE